MTQDEARLVVMGAISMALESPTLQQGFEIICKNLSELEKENTELNDKLNNLSSVAAVRLANWQKYEKENTELEKQVKDLEWQLQEVAKDNDIYQAENKRLKKENAELKRIVKMVAMIKKGIYTEEGIKAIYAEAEQFIKESE